MTERQDRDDWIEVSRSPKKTSGCGIAVVIVAVVAGLVFIPLLVIALAVVLWARPGMKEPPRRFDDPVAADWVGAPKAEHKAPARVEEKIPEPVPPAGNTETKVPIEERAKQKTVDEWTAQLKEVDPERRCEAARALQEYGSQAKAAIGALAEALHDKHEDLRCQAAVTLGAIGPEARSALPALKQMLKDEHPARYTAIARATVKIDPQAALPALQELIQEEFRDLGPLIDIVADIGPPAIPTLVQLTRTREGDTPRQAALALGRIGRPALPALRELLRDKNEALQRAAGCGLGKLGAEAWPFVKEFPPETRFNVAVGLEGANEEGISTLLKLHRDADPAVRRAATVALGYIVARMRATFAQSPPAKERQASEAAVVKVIVESLRDQDADVRWAAVHALGTMKAPEAVTLLTTLLRAPEAGLRRDAATALGRIGLAARPAIPALKALLQDRDATVFRAADEALQKIEAVNPANPALRALYGGPGTNQNFMDPFTMPPGNRQPGQQPRSTIVPPPTFPRGALPKPKGGQPSRPPFFPPR